MYRIIKIEDRDGNEKLDDIDAMSRVGRIIDENKSTISVGNRGFFWCIYPGYSKSILTSKIIRTKWHRNTLTIITENSKYYLSKISDYKKSKNG